MSPSPLTFAFMPAIGSPEQESLLLATSLRSFGGALSKHPLWVLMPHSRPLSAPAQAALSGLDVRILTFEVDESVLKFPFAAKAYAAAEAERLADGESALLAWMDSDTLLLNSPDEFLLSPDKRFGARPVMLKNISSLYDQPLDPFWELIYTGCGAPPERIFPQQTIIDDVRIRPQYNAGLMVVRPEDGLLRAWRDNFQRLYREAYWQPFYDQNVLYYIFIHQAILSATLLTRLERRQIQEFSEWVNYPVFLHQKYPPTRRPKRWNDLITARYDEFTFFQQPGWRTVLKMQQPLKDWMEKHISA